MLSVYFGKRGQVWYSIALNEDKKIIGSSFSLKARREAALSVFKKLPLNLPFTVKSEDQHVQKIFNAMSNIYEGVKPRFSSKISMDHLPSFTKRVLEAVMDIPHGFVSTYGGVASALAKKDAARAVGNAMARNPFPLIVPCHRVVCSDLTLGGYGYGLKLKKLLLEREGVRFRNIGSSAVHVDSKHVYVPPQT